VCLTKSLFKPATPDEVKKAQIPIRQAGSAIIRHGGPIRQPVALPHGKRETGWLWEDKLSFAGNENDSSVMYPGICENRIVKHLTPLRFMVRPQTTMADFI
jgi:hypothetical protein